MKTMSLKLYMVAGELEVEIAEGTFVEGDHFVYIDDFNRTWKLEPITNENIMMPFKITPLPQVGDK